MGKDIRQHHRSILLSEVSYRHEKNPMFGGCIAQDVSESGIKIKILEFFPPGSPLELQFKLPMSPKAFVVKGKVAWINKLPYNEQWEVGVDFKMDAEHASLIRRYVATKKALKIR